MNDETLEKALSEMSIPMYDEHAKQQAIKFAMSEFDAVQSEQLQKKAKKIQGLSFWSRLIGKSSQNQGQQKMKAKPFYGGIIVFSVITFINIIFTNSEIMHPPYGAPAGGWTLYPPSAELSLYTRLESSINDYLLSDNTTGYSDKEVNRLAGEGFSTKINGEDEYSVDNFYPEQAQTKFASYKEHSIKRVSNDPISTFSIDVDTAAYSFVRNRLNNGYFPPKDAVRSEEMINYFDYAWPAPLTKSVPFATSVAVIPSPWREGNKLINIGIKGYSIAASEVPRSNLVFLLDISGSMQAENKLPLVKRSLQLLLNNLKPNDTVSIVTYTGAVRIALHPTKVKNRTKIIRALQQLTAAGATAGAHGIQTAYAVAEENYDKNALNRIILATDGDFNVGITDNEALKDFVTYKRKSGIFLSVLGFGMDNLNDELMQTLAQNGNGTAAYIDTLAEARKVLVEEAYATLFTIAKDVKLQVEFNPDMVAEYRLIGYESRTLQREDFKNDKVDAGDIGAGHTLTAIYEITPTASTANWIENSRYQQMQVNSSNTDFRGEYAFLKIRYKLPDSDTSSLLTTPISTENEDLTGQLINEANWATAVAGFSQLLKDGKYIGNFNYDSVLSLALKAKGEDLFGYRAEFINLVRLAKSIQDM